MVLDSPAVISATRAAPRVVLRPPSGWRPLDLGELWRHRELLSTFVSRDIRIRYKQTTLGVLWAILQPVITMIIFTMISRVGGISTDGAPPQVFYYCGMLLWLLFANGVSSAAN